MDVCVIHKRFCGGGDSSGLTFSSRVKEKEKKKKKKLFLGCGLASRQKRGRFNPLAAFPLVDTRTNMPVPGAGKQTEIRHSRRGSPGVT